MRKRTDNLIIASGQKEKKKEKKKKKEGEQVALPKGENEYSVT